MFLSLIESFLRNISGAPGFFLRRLYYSKRLGKCGKKLIISEGVYFDQPHLIEIGDYVWIDRNAIFIAGKIQPSPSVKIQGSYTESLAGKIVVGSKCHFGIGTIVQGHGGIFIGDHFTSSAYCKLYSYSNDPFLCKEGTIQLTGTPPQPSILHQITIGDNVWLGLNTSCLGGSIGHDTFVKPNTIISGDVEPNSILSGYPAKTTRSRFS